MVPNEAELRLYTQTEAAHLLRCSLSHLKRLRQRGAIRFARTGRNVVIFHADLADFLARRVTEEVERDAA